MFEKISRRIARNVDSTESWEKKVSVGPEDADVMLNAQNADRLKFWGLFKGVLPELKADDAMIHMAQGFEYAEQSFKEIENMKQGLKKQFTALKEYFCCDKNMSSGELILCIDDFFAPKELLQKQNPRDLKGYFIPNFARVSTPSAEAIMVLWGLKAIETKSKKSSSKTTSTAATTLGNSASNHQQQSHSAAVAHSTSKDNSNHNVSNKQTDSRSQSHSNSKSQSSKQRIITMMSSTGEPIQDSAAESPTSSKTHHLTSEERRVEAQKRAEQRRLARSMKGGSSVTNANDTNVNASFNSSETQKKDADSVHASTSEPKGENSTTTQTFKTGIETEETQDSSSKNHHHCRESRSKRSESINKHKHSSRESSSQHNSKRTSSDSISKRQGTPSKTSSKAIIDPNGPLMSSMSSQASTNQDEEQQLQKLRQSLSNSNLFSANNQTTNVKDDTKIPTIKVIMSSSSGSSEKLSENKAAASSETTATLGLASGSTHNTAGNNKTRGSRSGSTSSNKDTASVTKPRVELVANYFSNLATKTSTTTDPITKEKQSVSSNRKASGDSIVPASKDVATKNAGSEVIPKTTANSSKNDNHKDIDKAAADKKINPTSVTEPIRLTSQASAPATNNVTKTQDSNTLWSSESVLFVTGPGTLTETTASTIKSYDKHTEEADNQKLIPLTPSPTRKPDDNVVLSQSELEVQKKSSILITTPSTGVSNNPSDSVVSSPQSVESKVQSSLKKTAVSSSAKIKDMGGVDIASKATVTKPTTRMSPESFTIPSDLQSSLTVPKEAQNSLRSNSSSNSMSESGPGLNDKPNAITTMTKSPRAPRRAAVNYNSENAHTSLNSNNLGVSSFVRERDAMMMSTSRRSGSRMTATGVKSQTEQNLNLDSEAVKPGPSSISSSNQTKSVSTISDSKVITQNIRSKVTQKGGPSEPSTNDKSENHFKSLESATEKL